MEPYAISFKELLNQFENGIITEGTYHIADKGRDFKINLDTDSIAILDFDDDETKHGYINVINHDDMFVVYEENIRRPILDWYKKRTGREVL